MATTPKIDMNKLITDAENGDVQARNTLAEMVFKGLEMTANREYLYNWFSKVTNLDKSDATSLLVKYAVDKGHLEKVEELLLQCCDVDDPEIKCHLALLYCTDGWEKYDEQKGIQLYKEAAEAGSLEAMTALGMSDTENAQEWLDKAVAGGSEAAKRVASA